MPNVTTYPFAAIFTVQTQTNTHTYMHYIYIGLWWRWSKAFSKHLIWVLKWGKYVYNMDDFMMKWISAVYSCATACIIHTSICSAIFTFWIGRNINANISFCLKNKHQLFFHYKIINLHPILMKSKKLCSFRILMQLIAAFI